MNKIEHFKARNLLRLARWHKKTCNIEDCGINTYLVLEDFEKYKGKRATKKERSNFM